MTPPHQFVLANWGSRPVTPTDLLRFLLRLREATPTWAQFHQQTGREIGDAVSRVSLDATSITDLLEKSLLRRDLDHSVLLGSGALVGLWNGSPSFSAASALSLGVGAIRGHGLLNTASVDLPRLAPMSGKEEGLEVMRAVVEVWQPEYAWSGTYDHRESQDAGPDTVGRITFIRHPDLLPALPDDVTVEPFPGGVLLTLQDGPTDHLERAKTLRQQLKDSGALPDPPITSVVP